MKQVKIKRAPKNGTQKDYAFVWNNDFTLGNSKPTDSTTKTLAPVPRNQANIEAEAGESVIGDFDQDGQLEHMNIGGKKHYNGGTPLNVPNGAFIFSDAPKMKLGGEILGEFGKSPDTKKKFTPAQLARQYDLNKFKDLLDHPLSDRFDKDTADLMLKNNHVKLAKLAFVQEGMKGEVPPQIASQLLQGDGQEEMKYGGLPKAANGMSYPVVPLGASNTPQGGITPTGQPNVYDRNKAHLRQWEQVIPGVSRMSNKDAQSAIYDYMMKSPEGQASVRNMWNTYGLTNEGKKYSDLTSMTSKGVFNDGSLANPNNLRNLKKAYVDGMFGARQLNPITDPQGPTSTTPRAFRPFNPQLAQTPGPNVNFGAPSQIPPIQTNQPGKAAPKPTTPDGITPNMWDLAGTLHAITRPIDHIRPNLYRVNPNTVNPSLINNTAEIQQIQSNGRVTNDLIQNGSTGEVARANAIGSQGRLLDAINQSNARMNNSNVGIVNQTAEYNNNILNQAAVTNMGELQNYAQQNDMYRANLSKEKNLKFNDIIAQGSNMTNNMMRLAAIEAQNPQYKASPYTWFPGQFVPTPGNPLKGSTGQAPMNPFEQYQQIKDTYGLDDRVIMKLMNPTSYGSVEEDYDGNNNLKRKKIKTPTNQ